MQEQTINNIDMTQQQISNLLFSQLNKIGRDKLTTQLNRIETLRTLRSYKHSLVEWNEYLELI